MNPDTLDALTFVLLTNASVDAVLQSVSRTLRRLARERDRPVYEAVADHLDDAPPCS